VEALQVEGERHLWAVQLRVAVAAGRPHNDVGKVCLVTRCHSISQAEKSGSIRYAEAVVLQGFAVAATEVCELRRVAVVCLRPNVDPVSLSRVFAVVETVIHAVRSITISISARRFGDRLFAAE